MLFNHSLLVLLGVATSAVAYRTSEQYQREKNIQYVERPIDSGPSGNLRQKMADIKPLLDRPSDSASFKLSGKEGVVIVFSGPEMVPEQEADSDSDKINVRYTKLTKGDESVTFETKIWAPSSGHGDPLIEIGELFTGRIVVEGNGIQLKAKQMLPRFREYDIAKGMEDREILLEKI